MAISFTSIPRKRCKAIFHQALRNPKQGGVIRWSRTVLSTSASYTESNPFSMGWIITIPETIIFPGLVVLLFFKGLSFVVPETPPVLWKESILLHFLCNMILWSAERTWKGKAERTRRRSRRRAFVVKAVDGDLREMAHFLGLPQIVCGGEEAAHIFWAFSALCANQRKGPPLHPLCLSHLTGKSGMRNFLLPCLSTQSKQGPGGGWGLP